MTKSLVRVVHRGDGISIYTAAGDLRPLRRAGLSLHFSIRPRSAGRSILDSLGDRAWIECDVVQFGVGHRGDEGWRSTVGDDSISVADEDSLRVLRLAGVRLIALSDMTRLEGELGVRAGEEKARERGSSANPVRQDGRGVLGHIEAATGSADECAYFTAGLPDEGFRFLMEECLGRRVDEIYVHGVGDGLSTAAEFETARDVVFRVGEQISVHIDIVSFQAELPAKRSEPDSP